MSSVQGLGDEAVLSPFVSVAELTAWQRSEEPPKLVDARAERAYREGHLPGAVQIDARSLNAPKEGVRQLITLEGLKAVFEARGLGSGPIVVYGAKGGTDAAHVWWTLETYGHPAVFLLDGGVEAWLAAGEPLASREPEPTAPASPFEPVLDESRFISGDELKGRLDDPNLAIVDTRSRDEFEGKDVFAERGGHIPGAVLRSWDEMLEENLRLLSSTKLRENLEPLLTAPEVAVYCQSGVRAAHTYAVLKGLGHPNPRLYLGSWSEWGNRDGRPVAQENPNQEVRT